MQGPQKQLIFSLGPPREMTRISSSNKQTNKQTLDAEVCQIVWFHLLLWVLYFTCLFVCLFVCSKFDRGYCPYRCSASRCKVLLEASLWQYWQQTENRTRLAFCSLSPQSNQLVPPDYFDHMMVVNRTIKRPSRQKGTIATRIR